MDLPQLQVGTWGGFVFVNPDPEAEPLEDFLGDLDRHFEAWPLDRRYVQAHVAKIIDCNWKVAQEAFSEALHVITTHPQRVAGMGDANSQYDVWGNFDRGISANGVPSPHLRWEPTEQEMFDSMVDARMDEPALLEVPDGMTARELSGMLSRESLRPIIGDEAADLVSDAESLDSIYYTVFPNFHPWGAYQRIAYRFRPHQDQHEMCLMDVYFLAPFTGERPAAGEDAVARRRRLVDPGDDPRLVGAGLRPGLLQHAEGAARHAHDAGEDRAVLALPGEQDPALPPPADAVDRRGRRRVMMVLCT